MCKTQPPIQIDKIRTEVPLNKCKIPSDAIPSDKIIGLRYEVRDGFLKLDFSGKIFAEPYNTGDLNRDNMELLVPTLYNISNGIEIDEDVLINSANVFSVQIKKDLTCEDNLNYYFSELTEIFKKDTSKFNVYRYGDMKVTDSLRLVPKARSNKIIFSVYKKGVELGMKRNKEYRKRFSDEYLSELDKTIRMEYQINNYKTQREEFGLYPFEIPTISRILDCERNVVADFFDNLINKEGK